MEARIHLSRFVVTGCAAKTSATVTFPSLNLISLFAFCFNIWLNGVASYPSLVSWIKHSVDRFVIVSIFIPKLRLILILNSFMGSSRSEERRVGKDCRCRWSPYHEKKKKTW